MAIQFIGSAVGVDTATLPTHRAGDLIVVFAYSDATTTVPALVTGYTNAPNNAAGGNSNAHRVAYKLATSSAEAVGTWTGATQLAVAVYRGVDQTTPVGAGAAMTGITDVTYPALTLQGPPSWVIAAHGRRTGNQENVAVPPGTVLRGDTGTSGAGRVVVFDTNQTVSSWPQTASGGNNTFRYRSASVELRPAAEAERRTGTVNATLGALTSTASGRLALKGVVARTLAALTGQGAGRLAVKGLAGGTLSPVTVSSSGRLAITGQGAATLAPLTSAGEARLQAKGDLAATFAPLTAQASGRLSVVATVHATLAPLTAAGSGGSGTANEGRLAGLLAPLTLDGRGRVAIRATATATLAPLSTSASGGPSIAGRMMATLGALTARIRATLSFPTRTPAARVVRVRAELRLARVAHELRVVRVAAKETATMSLLTWPFKDPDEELDYQIVWADRLAGDTIQASAWTVPAGLTLQREDSDDTSATIWLAGGAEGQTYAVLNRITTTAGRIMDQSIKLSVKAK